MMELKVTRLEPELIRLETAGKISRDDWPVGHDPLADLCGKEIYSNGVLLNVENSPYIDSTGVEWLLMSHQRCKREGGRLVIHSPPPTVLQILKVMRMHLVLNLAEDETRAMSLVCGETNGSQPRLSPSRP